MRNRSRDLESESWWQRRKAESEREITFLQPPCVWHTTPTLHPAWAAGQVAYERGTAENPFCFSGFPLLFSGAYNCLRSFCGHTMFQFPPLHFFCSPLLFFSLTVFILPSHQGATKLDVRSQITNHTTSPVSLGNLEEKRSCFAQIISGKVRAVRELAFTVCKGRTAVTHSRKVLPKNMLISKMINCLNNNYCYFILYFI